MAAGGSGRATRYARTAVDALAYALVVTAAAVVLAIVVGVAAGAGLVGAKLLLFLLGLVLMAIAVGRLWPTSPTTGADVTVQGSGGRPARTTATTRVEGVTASLPPLRWMDAPRRRLSPPAKLFLASLFVLGASLLLEIAFAVE